MKREIGVMGIQVGMTDDKHDNLKRALSLIEEGFERYKKIDVICLPELYYSNPTKENRSWIGEELDSEFFHEFSACAKKHHVNIITGSYPLIKGDQLLNTCLCIDRQGNLIGDYSKTHLFDAFTSKESDTVDAGSEIGIFDFDFGKVGIAICYELRFPDYLRTLALKGIDILFVPSAFYTPRHDQWDVLVQSAALDNLMYVVALNQYNSHFFGRSCITDPCGLIVSKASDQEGIMYGVLDMDYQEKVRNQVPTYQNRRPELYDIR